MRRLALFTLVSLTTLSLAARAQQRKPGLYELTVTTTSLSPNPTTMPPHVSQVCLTPEMLDKYGAIVPQTRGCQVVNVVKKPSGMTADMVCSGAMSGKGALEATWVDIEHGKGSVRFSGTMQTRSSTIKIEWNSASSSVYKGPDCGSIKPATP